MDKVDANYWLVIIGLALIAIEIAVGAATGFDLLLIGLICLASGIAGFILSSATVSFVLVGVLAFFYVIAGRRMVRMKLNAEAKATNVDALMGRTAIVTKKIIPHHAGQVKIDGEVWRAESDGELAVGDKVKITSVSGVTLKVQ